MKQLKLLPLFVHKILRLSPVFMIMGLLWTPLVSAFDPGLYRQSLTPFYSENTNTVSCTNGFLGSGPLFGPTYPTGLTTAQLSDGLKTYITNTHPNSPLLDYINVFIKGGQAHGVNPAMVIAMAQVETQLGTVGNGTPSGGYNFNNIRPGGHFADYASYPIAIETTYKQLDNSLYLKPPANFNTVSEIINRWAPAADNNNVNVYLQIVGEAMAKMLSGGSAPSDQNADSCSAGGSGGNGKIDNSEVGVLAQKLLSSPKYNCDGGNKALATRDCADLKAMVDGKSLEGEGSCLADRLEPRVLQLLVYLIDNNFQIGTYALCSDHSNFDGKKGRGHVYGFAVDISTVNYKAVAADTSRAEVLKLDQFLNDLPAQLVPDQLISYGYGNKKDNEIAALQMIEGKKCASVQACENAYHVDVEQGHTNHIHVGYSR